MIFDIGQSRSVEARPQQTGGGGVSRSGFAMVEARLGEAEFRIAEIRRVAIGREFSVLDAVLGAGVLALAGAAPLYFYVNV